MVMEDQKHLYDRDRPLERVNLIAEHFKTNSVITIVGSGNSAHVCAALFHDNTDGAVTTQILTSTPEVWSPTPAVRFLGHDEKKVLQKGKIALASANPADVIPNADIVLYTGPVHATTETFKKIKPYVDVKKTIVGTIFAQGLVHISAVRTFGKEVRFFALRNIPWLCRCIEKGKLAEIVGPKTSLEAISLNCAVNEVDWFERTIEPLFTCQKIGRHEPRITVMPDFCPIIFNPANQIIHPAAYWGHFRRFDGVHGMKWSTDTSAGDISNPGARSVSLLNGVSSGTGVFSDT